MPTLCVGINNTLHSPVHWQHRTARARANSDTLGRYCVPVQATAIMALLQPSPEVFQLFDDVMLLSDGMCVFFGPREGVLPFFEAQGFKCPPRMPVPGFLQNITSRRDQRVSQSWPPA